MKKMMFNDRYGLTQDVLEGRKTMTRRLVKDANLLQWLHEMEVVEFHAIKGTILDEYSKYKVGEVVAVAQSYLEAYEELLADEDWDNHRDKWHAFRRFLFNGEDHTVLKGWKNKMFVKSEVMPNRIRITDIKVERLQGISDEDCLKEGVYANNAFEAGYGIDWVYEFKNAKVSFLSPREAFAALIDKVGKKGTWERNPWVFAYEFELVKGGE